MIEPLIIMVTALVVLAVATLVGPRLGIAAPLVLVVIGVAASFLPVFEAIHIEPAWILEGVLPPLLYSSAVAMPSMNFRREFGAISGLSVVLVVLTSLALGLFFFWAIPDLGFAWGVALGAIISPTDAVASSLIKQQPVSKRVVAMLDGESLLNDATALVLLRTAIVATASAFSFWGAVGTFAFSVVVAIAVGGSVGWANLVIRRQVTDPTVNTVISFTVPFAAMIPTELLGGSGLVAAVVAGLITGFRAPRELSPQNRLSDSQNWCTVEFVLEGAVFLTMGLQMREIITKVDQDHAGVLSAVLVALGALALTVLTRTLYVAPLLGSLGARSRRGLRLEPRLHDMQENMHTPDGQQETMEMIKAHRRRATEWDFERFAQRVTRGLADIDYFRREPMGWREGTLVVWAGMRGAVTVAAAQSLPDDTPQRSFLVLIAFTVAVLSLVLQGGSLSVVIRLVADKTSHNGERLRKEQEKVQELMAASAAEVMQDHDPEDFVEGKQHMLRVIAAQRSALLDARDNGTFDADVLAKVLADLDASQVAVEARDWTIY